MLSFLKILYLFKTDGIYELLNFPCVWKHNNVNTFIFNKSSRLKAVMYAIAKIQPNVAQRSVHIYKDSQRSYGNQPMAQTASNTQPLWATLSDCQRPTMTLWKPRFSRALPQKHHNTVFYGLCRDLLLTKTTINPLLGTTAGTGSGNWIER